MTTTTHLSGRRYSRRTWILTGVIALCIAVVAGGFIYWYSSGRDVYIDTASIEAPQIALSPSTPGTLDAVYVNEGDTVAANQTVARVGNELVKSKVAGIIVSVPETIGAQINPGEAVVTMIDPSQLRVVGSLDENKGLNRVKVGDPVTFTVDAFGGKQFSAIVDEISPTSKQSGVVFNISNTREIQQFEIKARFDTSALSELKNGMSARMWIYTK